MTLHAEPSTDVPRRVQTAFRAEFPGDAPRVFFAPGRVNLIGAHLDYSGGDVLPLAVDLGVYVAARPRTDGVLRLRSLDQPERVDVALAGLDAVRDPSHGWAAFPLGVVREFVRVTGWAGGADLVFGGDLPMASGMSSSAAIAVATAVALDAWTGSGLERLAIARLAHRAETGYVQVECGIMDQFASALARSGHALLLHCADESFEHVAIHGSGFEVLVMDTRKPRTLAGSAFNARVRECREAHAVLRQQVRDLPWLAQYSAEDLQQAGASLSGLLRSRATHVVEEMARVASAVRALDDGDVRAFGALVHASHRSTATHYAVSCDELDVITDLACAQPSTFGARLTGAGFGGCAIALIEPGTADAVVGPVRQGFAARFGVEPGFRVLHAGPGPRELEA
jgi:galactokinase